ncbi:hypothetical protein [Halobaculum magnesiiphilum]|uniref:Uncharacterized protein n=1 Tax=Halobaculum magnesiiphilum TaxID=1017351 RepID=A0A8T8W907_9EURY|nr:hypothetical protein [Halobaculum magnesiiphilum]QZP36342.1 hypothetical protein K6T50_08320 [Halobaculum magnesiiphilum]
MSENDDTHPSRERGCGSEDAQSKGDPDENDTATRTAKRVNITISEGQHETLVDFAKENGMTFSELVRRSCAHFRNQHENDQTARELQPLLHEIRKHSDQLESQATLIEALGSRLDDLSESFEGDSDRSDLSDEELADELWKILDKDETLTTLEIMEDTELDRRQVHRGLNRLRDSHVAREVETQSGGTGWVATA